MSQLVYHTGCAKNEQLVIGHLKGSCRLRVHAMRRTAPREAVGQIVFEAERTLLILSRSESSTTERVPSKKPSGGAQLSLLMP